MKEYFPIGEILA